MRYKFFPVYGAPYQKLPELYFQLNQHNFLQVLFFVLLKSNFGQFKLEFGSYRRVRIHFKLNRSSGKLIKIHPLMMRYF